MNSVIIDAAGLLTLLTETSFVWLPSSKFGNVFTCLYIELNLVKDYRLVVCHSKPCAIFLVHFTTLVDSVKIWDIVQREFLVPENNATNSQTLWHTRFWQSDNKWSISASMRDIYIFWHTSFLWIMPCDGYSDGWIVVSEGGLVWAFVNVDYSDYLSRIVSLTSINLK